MNRVNFARLSGTIIDVCRGHGTFLDSGELHAIVTFIHGGGLERVRQHELDSLKEAKRQLDAAQKLAPGAHARVRTWDLASGMRHRSRSDGGNLRQVNRGSRDDLRRRQAAVPDLLAASGSKFSATPLMQ